MSIPDSNEEVFSIPDIMECTGETESVILNKIDNLHNLSFCVGKNGNYSSPNLVKIFSSKKLSLDKSINVDELKEKYNKLAQEKNRLNKMSDSFYSNAKAYTYSEKTAAYMMKVLVDEFELTDNKDDVIKKMNNLEEENPNFAFIFFRRALFEKDLGSNYEVIRSYFERALELDSTNDHYWAEFAFYIEKIIRNEAIGFFKNAIKLNDNNCSAHHGLAISLTKLYNNKEELFIEKDAIIKEYIKGYSNIENIYWIKHNIVNAHSHISYLRSIQCINEALNVCLEWLQKYPNENKLLVLEGQLRKKIDPMYINKERINNMKTGIFRNADDATIANIIRKTNYRKK